MKIVIVGDGKVGQALTGRLAEEGHDVVVIDNSPNALRNSVEVYDVMGISGNGASYAVQKEAGVQEADLLIAATSGDELNLLCCMVAKKLGAKHTIARVRNPDYEDQLVLMKEELGLSMTINPEQAAAREIARMLRFPSALKLDSFARGQVELVEIKVKAGSPLLGQALYALSGSLGIRILICAVRRGDDIYIPSGSFVLQEEDKITITASPSELDSLFRKLGIYRQKIHRVMVVGGGRIAYYLAKQLLKLGMWVKIIDKDPQRCEQLSDALPKAQVVLGDGSDRELLEEEGIEDMDALVALTGMDEENIIISMYAGTLGLRTIFSRRSWTAPASRASSAPRASPSTRSSGMSGPWRTPRGATWRPSTASWGDGWRPWSSTPPKTAPGTFWGSPSRTCGPARTCSSPASSGAGRSSTPAATIPSRPGTTSLWSPPTNSSRTSATSWSVKRSPP